MASVPTIPPLLCSTPPPIEFSENDEDSGLSPTLTLEDEDDVFGEYTSTHEGLTPDVPSLPRTPLQNELSSSTTSGFTDTMQTVFDDSNVLPATTERPLDICDHNETSSVTETYNYAINRESPVQLRVLEDTINHESNLKEKEIDINSREHTDNITNTQSQTHVLLEDIPDDISDDELHSPKELICDTGIDVNSSNFFAIHTVSETEETTHVAENTLRKEASPTEVETNDDSFAEFATFDRSVSMMATEDLKESFESRDIAFEADFSAFAQTNNDDSVQIVINETENVANVCVVDDDFDDFQDFNAVINNDNSESKIDADVFDDDEFGDFAEATITPETTTTISQEPDTETTTCTGQQLQTAVNLNNLHERLKTILEMMFPSDTATVTEEVDSTILPIDKLENEKSLQLESIDAAKALKYQWSGSEMRHALIKSIGIDSRNILYGEKWNSSMPRFAADLSVNPLQPIKPQNASSIPSTSGSISSKKNGNCEIVRKQNDVPAVDFDWNSSGLVNPLDGKHVCAIF